ncbi:MAG: glycosyltransferase family 2 protein [Planctomycetes bacterium]|nr:glycosyltransferase family 2 protein [Planctomycetota bacterium]
MTDLDLSVVIVSHNGEALLRDCLASLHRTSGGLRLEVFVVDSASSEPIGEMVRREFPGVRLIEGRGNLGFSAGNNAALGLCRGRCVLLLNPDTVVHAGALEAMVRYLDGHGAVGAVGPALRLADGTIQLEAARNLPTLGRIVPWMLLLDKLQWRFLHRQRRRSVADPPPRGFLLDRYCLFYWDRDAACSVEALCGACMMMPLEVVRRVGLLDEAVPLYLDDMDYCRRIRDAGCELHYLPHAAVTHLAGRSTSRLKRAGDLYAMQCHALYVYFRKHEPFPSAPAFALLVAAAAAARLAVWGLPALLSREARRRAAMGLALARWAIRFPKRAPRMGFVCEQRAAGGAAV